jgi:peptidoglycan/LPS O-acetylase OafA/YrhL
MGTLRFLLAMVVVLFHYQTVVSGIMDSHTAVKAFFMISGFYMALILDQKYGGSTAGLRAFAINRFLRLYPLYAVVLILTIGWYLTRLVMIGDRTPVPGIIALQETLAGWQIFGIWVSNLSLIGLDFICTWDWSPEAGLLFLTPTAAASAGDSLNLASTVWVIQAWSISMEILFYLCAPFLARRKGMTLACVILASFGLDIWLSAGMGRTSYFFAPAQLYLFVTGMLLYRGYRYFKLGERVANHLAFAMSIAGILFVAIWSTPFLFGPSPHLITLIGIALLIPVLFAVSKDSVWDRAIGNLSYPIYLSHMLVGWVLAVAFKRMAFDPALAAFLMPAACVLFAMLLNQIVERPIEGIRSSISRRLTSASLNSKKSEGGLDVDPLPSSS